MKVSINTEENGYAMGFKPCEKPMTTVERCAELVRSFIESEDEAISSEMESDSKARTFAATLAEAVKTSGAQGVTVKRNKKTVYIVKEG